MSRDMKVRSLAAVCPDLVNEWDAAKNGDLTPDKVMAGSHRKLWWKCGKGHEWEAAIYNRVSGKGCPFCSGRYATQANNLAIRFTGLVSEWNVEKNGNLTPNTVMPGSHRKVWWKCPKGHEWEAAISNRMKGSGCPKCKREQQRTWRRATQANNLAIRFPELVPEWDVEKNGNLTPNMVMPGSRRKIWWKCSRGHKSYLASLNSRTCVNKTGCPLCNPRTSKVEFRLFCELLPIFPDAEWQSKVHKIECDIYLPSHSVVIEYDGVYWHSSPESIKRSLKKERRLKKYGITLFRLREHGLNAVSPLDVVIEEGRGVSLDSIKRLLQKLNSHVSMSPDEISKCHVYLNSPDFMNTERYAKTAHTLSIPRFEDSVAAHPILSKEWDDNRNGDAKQAYMFLLASNEVVWWKCSKGHKWSAPPASRTNMKSGCPFCSGRCATKDNNLAVRFPELIPEWNIETNGDLTPYDVTPHSGKKVWWKCSKGHEWLAAVYNRVKGHGCPYCSGKKTSPDYNLAIRFPELASEWDVEKNGDLTPYDVTPGSHRKVWWKCSKGHEWEAAISNRMKGRGCPYCAGQRVDKENNLAVRFPELVAEWDIEKKQGFDTRQGYAS